MKQISIFCLIALGILLVCAAPAAAQDDMPAPVRESAIADLNRRIPDIGRPTAWNYQIINSDNQNLGCPTAPPGFAMLLTQVYVVELIYPNGTYVYHVSADAQRVVPCDPKIPAITPQPTVLTTLSAPQSPAEYGYLSTSCPAELKGFSPARLEIGGFGLARAGGDPVILRQNFAITSPSLGVLPPLDRFYVLAGPECTGDGVVWWKIEWQGRVGWTAESRLGGYYFVEPISRNFVNVTVPPTAIPTASPTFTPTATPTPTPTFTDMPLPTPTFTATATSSPTPAPQLPPSAQRTPIDAQTAGGLRFLKSLLVAAQDAAWWGDQLVVASEAGLSYYDGITLVKVEAPFEVTEALTSVAVGGDFLAAGGVDRLLTVNLETGVMQNLPEIAGEVDRLDLSADGLLASPINGAAPLLKLWKVDPAQWQTPSGLVMVVPLQGRIAAAAFNSQGFKMALQDAAQVYLLDAVTGQTLASQPLAVGEGCGGAAFLPDDRLVYADCHTLYVLNDEAPQPLLTLDGEQISDVILHPAGVLLAVQTDQAVILVDPTTGAEIFRAVVRVRRTLFDEAGTLLTLVTPDGIEFWGVGG